jgi:hypothetical protein
MENVKTQDSKFIIFNNYYFRFSNQINISAENLNEQIIWLRRENILKNFLKDKKNLSGAAKSKIYKFY